VEVGGAALLGFDGAEVLHLPPDAAPSVLPEPVHQRREVDGVAGGPPVVIGVGVYRRPVTINLPVGVQGEGEEGGGPVVPSEHPPEGAVLDGSAGQVRGVLAAPGGALDRLGWRVQRGKPAPHPGRPEFGVQHGHRVGDLLTGGLITPGAAVRVSRSEVSSGGHECLVVLARCGPLGDRLHIEVPALAALGHPQPPRLLRTRFALVLPGGAAGHRDDLHPPGGGVDPAHRQRPHTDSVLLGDGLDDLRAQGQCGPLCPGHPRGIQADRLSNGHQRITSPGVARSRRTAKGTVLLAPGARSAPIPCSVNGRLPYTWTWMPSGS
jgi:hypothetical protein